MKKIPLLILLYCFAISVKAQQKIIPLYIGTAPGSESWTWDEKQLDSNLWHTPVVYNVTRPALIVFPAEPQKNTSTAVIVCPGGGFQALSIKSEGTDVALWLKEKGITAFVLKYRVMHTLTNDPTKEQQSKPARQTEDDQNAIAPLCIADTRAAIAYVRRHAAEFGISPSRIVVLGFSAGGTLAASSACGYTPENRPTMSPRSMQGWTRRQFRQMHRRCSWPRQATISLAWRLMRLTCITVGLLQNTPLNCISMLKEGTVSGCANKAFLPMPGSSAFTTG